MRFKIDSKSGKLRDAAVTLEGCKKTPKYMFENVVVHPSFKAICLATHCNVSKTKSSRVKSVQTVCYYRLGGITAVFFFSLYAIAKIDRARLRHDGLDKSEKKKTKKASRNTDDRLSSFLLLVIMNFISASSHSARQVTQFRDINVRTYLLRDSRVYMCLRDTHA